MNLSVTISNPSANYPFVVRTPLPRQAYTSDFDMSINCTVIYDYETEKTLSPIEQSVGERLNSMTWE